MFADKQPNEEQLNHITGIVNRYVREARTSSKETAWHDARRKGMDAITNYCHAQGLALLGDHMIRADFQLSDR
jgi:hypothetical protein